MKIPYHKIGTIAFLSIAVALIGCRTELGAGAGGHCSTSSSGSGGEGGGGVGGNGGGGSGGATTSTSSGAPMCFVNADCHMTINVSCYSAECDPTGKKTAPESSVIGCYLLANPIGTSCYRTEDGTKGSCTAVDGTVVCEVPM